MYYFLKSTSFLFSLFPNSWLHNIARFFAWLAYKVLGFRRKTVESNLRIAFGDKWEDEKITEVALQCYYHFFLTALEFMASYKGDMPEWIEFEGEEHLKKALAKDKGVFILCMHIGNWEAMGSAVSKRLVPSHVVVKKVGSESVNRFVSETRAKNNFLVIERKKKGDAIKKIINVLKNKEVVGFVMDQARPGAPRLPFFGKPAKTNTGLAFLLAKNPVPVVLAYDHRIGVKKHRVIFEPEIDLHLSGDKDEDIKNMTILFNQKLEHAIRTRPEQYFWLHKRWK